MEAALMFPSDWITTQIKEASEDMELTTIGGAHVWFDLEVHTPESGPLLVTDILNLSELIKICYACYHVPLRD